MTPTPLDAARLAANKAEAAQDRADAARKDRDAAIVDAVRAGFSIPTVAAQTRLSRAMVRKVLLREGQEFVAESLGTASAKES